MFSLPQTLVNRSIRALRDRLGNLPEAEFRTEFERGMEAGWQDLMGKAERYVQGQHILEKGGHFSSASCGNWFLIADAAGVERIPGRVVAVISPVMMLAADAALGSGDDVKIEDFLKNYGDQFNAFVNAIQGLGENEMIRYDTAADGRLKAEIALGRSDGTIPEFRGYRLAGHGFKLPEFDERILRTLLENPEDSSPVWAREWLTPRMRTGDRSNAFSYSLNVADVARASDPLNGDAAEAAIRVEESRAEFGDLASNGNLFPCEWRVFVKGGEVVGVGNYYTQVSRARDSRDEIDAAAAALEVKALAESMIEVIRERGAIPHHPQYENPARRNFGKGFDPDGLHFSVDFMEVEDLRVPFGRRLVLVDAGVAHLRAPAFGVHPVSFGAERDPEGVAFGLGDVRSFEVVEEIVSRGVFSQPDTPSMET
ncbi:hypothetical protein ACEUZ9_000861 [Paracoccus litorisediminis]|uniref:hypothetical protein n=1 Tax=Paracoccus litorisediminis TaxID=2006130 RepID=UPI003730C772